jgi:hypothetical protein
MFVDHVRRQGLQEQKEADSPAKAPEATEAPPVRTASRPQPLTIPTRPDRLDPSAPNFDLERAVDAVREELERHGPGKTRGTAGHPETAPPRD